VVVEMRATRADILRIPKEDFHMNFVHFPKAEIGGLPTGNRNLYVDPLSVDLIFQDSDKPNVTAIVTGDIVQYVLMPIAQVVKALQVITFSAEGKKEEVEPLPVTFGLSLS